jgi:arylsulfatase A-like enzyme
LFKNMPIVKHESNLTGRAALLLAALVLCGALGWAALPAAAPPNIIYILADDLGYGDVGCYGQKTLPTPNLDRLAAEGMRFTQHYSGSTVCAPSRSAFLEGRHTGHCSVRGNQPPHLSDPDVITLPETLQAAGYTTAVIGKWGVGHPPPPDDPLRHGFDYAYGYINMWHAHNCFPEFLYRNGVREILPGNVTDHTLGFDSLPEGTGVAQTKVTYAPDLIEADALRFIATHTNTPFFLYLALNLPHNNGEAAKALGDGCEVPDYGAFADPDWPVVERGFARMVQYVDLTVGRIVAQLHKSGLEDNTLIVFDSDNGPYAGGGHNVEFFDSNGPLRGAKRDLYEGGIRAPFIARWPGRIQAGTVSDHINAMWDLYPTFCEAAGATVPGGLDGVSILPTLLGTEGQKEHDHLYWEFHEQGGKQAVRQGRWKAVRTHLKDAQPMQTELFDLSQDPGETRDLATERPDVLRDLNVLMQEAHRPNPALSFSVANPQTKP